MVSCLEAKNMQFAILECSGSSEAHPPEKSHIKNILEPFLSEKGWKVIYIAYIKDVATLVGIRSEITTEHTDLQKILSGFNKFIEEKYMHRSAKELRELQYPNLSLGSHIEIVTLLTSTGQDGIIFANQVVTAQLKEIQLRIEETEGQIESLAQRFRNF